MNFNSEREAQAFGRKIKKKLKGKGWKIRVWENLGWHVAWHLGRVSLYPSQYSDGPVKYHTLISDNDDSLGSGACMWTRNNYSEDPNEVVRQDLQYCLEVASDAIRGLKDVQKILKDYEKNVTGKKATKKKKAARVKG